MENNTIHFSVDKFKYEGQTFETQGWIFDDESKINRLYICMETANRSMNEQLNYGSERMDVYDAFGKENAKHSGFSTKIEVRTKEELKVYLCYETDKGEGRECIGTIKNSFANRAKTFCSKFDKRHWDILIKSIKNGNLREVLKESKTTRVTTTVEVKDRPELLSFIRSNVRDGYEVNPKIYDYTIDIIIPVYNGFEFFENLFKSIEKTKMKYRLILVNDKSPDEKVLPFLKEYASTRENVILLENEQNLGFVKSVNRALKETKNHVALVNTDVEVPEGWLERLMTPVIFGENIASSTPYTNSGTICSFPNFCENNAIFEGLTVNEVDKAFGNIIPRYVQMPTGVGFCMGMNKETIDKIGFLDDVTFEKGYGEENDWCQRAIKAGYKNVQVENLFVYHKHGGSFLSEEKKRLIEKNGKELLKKHPEYGQDVSKFINDDCNADIREYIKYYLLLKNAGAQTDLVITHNLGGGAESYIAGKIEEKCADNAVLIFRYMADTDKYELQLRYKEHLAAYRINSVKDLSTALDNVNINNIIVNELVSFPDLYTTIDEIIALKNAKKAALLFNLHDYYCMCPTINLLNKEGVYCKCNDKAECNACLKGNQYVQYDKYENIEKYQAAFKKLLENADTVTAYSESSKAIIANVLEINNIKVVPHTVANFPKQAQVKPHEGINVCLVGMLTLHKGDSVVRKVLEEIEKRNLDINIILIGKSALAIENARFTETGAYKRDELPALIEKYNIDIAFISSVWPETYSYTSEEVKKLGLPVIAFNMGAQKERLEGYDKGMLLDDIDAAKVVDAILKAKEMFR